MADGGDGRGKIDKAAIAVTIVLIGVFGLCQGLTYPLLSLILERQGVDAALIGANAAMMPLGIMVAAALLPALSQTIGAPRVALMSVVGEAVLLALAGLFQNVWAWFPIRFLLGCAVSGIYVTSEIWINELAPANLRGRLLGLFASALSLGFAIGPFILVWTGVEGLAPFAAIVAIMLAAALVLSLASSRMPQAGSHERVSVLGFLPLAPFLMALVLIVAAYDQAFLSLFSVFATSRGLGERTIPVAITAWAAGNILLQVPIGTLADRWSRRATAILLCGITVAGAVLLPLAIPKPWLFWPLLFVWGPASYGVYLLALMELGERFQGGALVAGNAAFAVMWGVGGMIGPPAVGGAMTLFGPRAFPIGLAVIYGVLLALVVARRSPGS